MSSHVRLSYSDTALEPIGWRVLVEKVDCESIQCPVKREESEKINKWISFYHRHT